MSGMYEDAFFDADLLVERALGLAGGLSLAERDALLAMHEALRPSIRRSLRKAFPGSCVGRVEDALQATGLAILERPGHFAEVVARGGINELKRQLTVVAWRALRGQLRKRGARLEDGDEEQMLAFAHPPGQELVAELQVGWAKAVRRAAVDSGGADIEAVGAISRLMTFPAWPGLSALAVADRGPGADPDGDGVSNLLEYAFARLPHLPDAAASPVQVESHADRLEIIFSRDERATDLTYDVQVRDNLGAGSWTTIARSVAGQPVAPVASFTPTITETSASAITSVRVIRKVRVADVQTMAGHGSRFLRVLVTQTTVP